MKEEKILVIIDMQNDFTTGVLGNTECTKAIDEVIDVVNKGEYDQIIFTRDTHTEDYMNTREGKYLPVPHCIKDSEGWNIVPSIMEAAEKKVTAARIKIFDKPTFGSVELGAYIKETEAQGAKLTIDFTGVCTGICVINNVAIVKANCPEVDVRVIEKACACVTPDSHNTAIAAMKTFQVDVI